MKAINLTKEIIIAVIQVVTMVVFYPVLFVLALSRQISAKYGFTSVGKFGFMYLFPAFGKWYLPMLWI